jgi:prepilin-type N-terminal cleavage/methylation domain-containing protein
MEVVMTTRYRKNRRSWRSAFTLVELLIVIAIIALLVSILLPSLQRAKQHARRVVCLTNLRGLASAAGMYATRYNGSYPIAYRMEMSGDRRRSVAWDFTTIQYRDGRDTEVVPGLLWDGAGAGAIQQCPSFDGGHNWVADPYTGYNYNTSYIGRGQMEGIQIPAHQEEVRNPSGCALFGDGQYAGGANKFMRSPFASPSDAGFSGRAAGTQGFRHLETTCVAWADGHADWQEERHTDTIASQTSRIGEGCGFLSEDNSAYDLE